MGSLPTVCGSGVPKKSQRILLSCSAVEHHFWGVGGGLVSSSMMVRNPHKTLFFVFRLPKEGGELVPRYDGIGLLYTLVYKHSNAKRDNIPGGVPAFIPGAAV